MGFAYSEIIFYLEIFIFDYKMSLTIWIIVINCCTNLYSGTKWHNIIINIQHIAILDTILCNIVKSIMTAETIIYE